MSLHEECNQASHRVTELPIGSILPVNVLMPIRSATVWIETHGKHTPSGCFQRKAVYLTQNYFYPDIKMTNSEILLEAAGRLTVENEKILRLLLTRRNEVIRHALWPRYDPPPVRFLAMRALAQMYEWDGNVDQAITFYTMISDEYPHEQSPGGGLAGGVAKLALAKLAFGEPGQESKGVNIIMSLLTQYADIPFVRFESPSTFDRTALYTLIKAIESSATLAKRRLEIIERVISSAKSSVTETQARILKGLWLRDDGDIAGFQAALRQAMWEPDSSWIGYMEYGHFGAAALHLLVEHYEKSGNISQAQETLAAFLNSAKLKKPQRVVALYHRGRLNAKQGQHEKALRDLVQSLNLYKEMDINDKKDQAFRGFPVGGFTGINLAATPPDRKSAHVGLHSIEAALTSVLKKDY